MLYTGEITKQIEVSTEEVAVDLKARGKLHQSTIEVMHLF